ncbi:S1 family peptidase [Kribbella amoyensis]|nr:S1 family peptidase [Kribbella amoyensis]
MRFKGRSLSLAVAAVSVSVGGVVLAGQPSVAQPLDTTVAVADPALTAARAMKEEAAASAPDGPQTALEKKFSQVDDYATKAGGLGVYLDKATGKYVVRMPRTAKATAKSVRVAGAETGVQQSRTTEAELTAVRTELEGRQWKSGAKKYSYGFHYDAQRDKVSVTTNAPAAVMQPLLAKYPALLEAKYGNVGRDTRQSDPAPHRGGASITNGTSVCTSGFTITSTARYMVTAGHCFAQGQRVYSSGGEQLWGTVRNRASFPYYDFEAIGGGTYGSVIYVGNSTGRTILVSGASDPAVGAAYCRSGQTTYEKCSQVVTSLHAQFCDESGCTPELISYEGPAGQGGDSGAPMYQYVNGTVQIRGMHIAHANEVQYAERWTTIRSVFKASIAIK